MPSRVPAVRYTEARHSSMYTSLSSAGVSWGTLMGMGYPSYARSYACALPSPNGLVANLSGPVEGKRHDSSMVAESNLYNQLVQYAVNRNRGSSSDPAYPHRLQLQGPFKEARLTQNEKDWNSAMGSVRVSVEWIFKDIINYFKFLDFKKNLKY